MPIANTPSLTFTDLNFKNKSRCHETFFGTLSAVHRKIFFSMNVFFDLFQNSLRFSIHTVVKDLTCFVFYGMLYWWSLLFYILKVLPTYIINLILFLYLRIFCVSARSALHLISIHIGIFFFFEFFSYWIMCDQCIKWKIYNSYLCSFTKNE